MSINQNNWKSGAFGERTRAAFEACAVVLSGREKGRSWAQASRRRYMGKYINWILWRDRDQRETFMSIETIASISHRVSIVSYIVGAKEVFIFF